MTTTEAPVIPDQFHAFLAEPRTAILSIERGPGRAPHSTPVWFDFVDGTFRISITRERVKFRLLSRAPAVSLVVDDATGYRSVIVEGPATATDDDEGLLSLAKTLRAKYRGGEPSPPDVEILRGLRAEQRVVVTIAPSKVLSWAR